MQDHMYELEKRHFEIVSRYEEEIKRLHALLDTRGTAGHDTVGAAPTPALPLPQQPHLPMPAIQTSPRFDRGAEPAWPPTKRLKTSPLPRPLPGTGADIPVHELPRIKRDEREKRMGERIDEEPMERAVVPPPATEEMAPASAVAPAAPAPSSSVPPKPVPSDTAPVPSAAVPPSNAPPMPAPVPANGAPTPADIKEPVNEIKKEGSDWVAVYNPKVKPALDVNLVHTLVHDSVVCCVCFSPDGKFLATGCNRSAQIFDTKTGAKVCELQDDSTGGTGDLYIRSVCFSPDGKMLATGAEDRQIRVWDLAERKIKMMLSGHKQEIYSLEYSRDGHILASGSGDKTVRIWDMEKGQELHVLYTSPGLNYGPGVTTITISPDGRLVAAGALDTFVRLWDTKTGKLRCRLKGHKDSIYSVSFMPDGQSLVSGSLDKTLKLWDLSLVIKALDSLDDEISNSSMCTATFIGHKVRCLLGCANCRTMCCPCPRRPTDTGLRQAPRTAASSSGIPRRRKRSWCCKATRIRVRHVSRKV